MADWGCSSSQLSHMTRLILVKPIMMQDYENIKKGIYKLPWDMTTPGHKQTNPLNILEKGMRLAGPLSPFSIAFLSCLSCCQLRHSSFPAIWLSFVSSIKVDQGQDDV